MPLPKTRAFLSIAALALGALLSGCIISSKTRTSHSGNYVSPETLAQIEPGAKKDYVIALLGEPSSKRELDGGTEIWRWRYREERSSSGHVFLIFDGDSEKSTERSTYVEFQDGVVKKAWRD